MGQPARKRGDHKGRPYSGRACPGHPRFLAENRKKDVDTGDNPRIKSGEGMTLERCSHLIGTCFRPNFFFGSGA